MKAYKKVKLQDISEKIGSGMTPLRTNTEYWNSKDIPWVKTELLGQYIISETSEYISQKAFDENSLTLFPANTLSIAMYGEGKTRGNVSIFGIPMTSNQACCNLIIDEQKADYKYVYYALKSNYDNLRNLASGVRNNLNADLIKNFEISLPDLPTQKKIADVLSCIDDKIALNNKTNTELENMAKTIYDYWFTQFDFPDKNGHPYKTSGGQMVYNEILKREIPAGWEVKSLSQICELQRGVTYGKDDEMSESDENVVQILRGNNISNNHIVYDSNTVYVSSDLVAEEQKIKKFDVVITMSSGSKDHVGKSAMFLFDSPHSYGAFCNKLTPINESQFFVENFMHSDFFKTYINHVCIGTGINNLKGEHFDIAYFAYPTDSVLKQFNEIMKPIYEKRSYMEQANEELTKLRDYLLPLLMNGQIEVKE